MKKLTEKEIRDLVVSCVFKEEELINGRPITEYTPIKTIVPTKGSIFPTFIFDTKKLNENKKTIIEYIDLLPGLNEGNVLENLYYDSEGNKWCEDERILDQLIILALACNLVTHTIISDEEVSIIKRTKENDNVLLEGLNPELLPENKNEIAKGYTEEELKLIAQNKIKITEDLNEYLEIIKTGFKFLGINVSLNKEIENQLDFYDSENNYITSKKIEDTDGIVGLNAVFNIRLYTEFIDTLGNEIEYFCDKDKHTFRLSSDENKLGYSISIIKKNNQLPSSIDVSVTDAKSDYIIKHIQIDECDLMVELNNQFGPYGNYEDGTKRYLWYRNPFLANGKSDLLFMFENEWYEKGHNLSCGLSGVTLDGKKITSYLSNEQFAELSTKIVSHPRNKELISFTIQELNKYLPNIEEYIEDNFLLYKLVFYNEYEPDEFVEEIIQSTIHEKCNLPKNSINKKELK